MSMAAVAGEMPLGAWLRGEREKRGWGRRETARRLIQAGRAAGDTALPGMDSMCTYVRRWERGTVLTERYRLYYCKAFGIPAAGFGCAQAPSGSPTGSGAFDAGGGVSVSVEYVSGRLVIGITGLEAPGWQEAGPGRGLSLVTPPTSPPRSYGGRA
jgi:hypothetical protein